MLNWPSENMGSDAPFLFPRQGHFDYCSPQPTATTTSPGKDTDFENRQNDALPAQPDTHWAWDTEEKHF